MMKPYSSTQPCKPSLLATAVFALLLLVCLLLNIVGDTALWENASSKNAPLFLQQVASYGWPFGCYFTFQTLGVTETNALLLTMNIPLCLLVAFLPAYVVERIYRRTLQIQLTTAMVLVLVASIALGLNLTPTVTTDWRFPYRNYGTPKIFCVEDKSFGVVNFAISGVATNALLALLLLSATGLLSEKILASRSRAARESNKSQDEPHNANA
jgi:O-antigen ligase